MELNGLGIAVATIIGMVLGALWYSPLLFGNVWMQCIGKTADTLGKSTGPMLGSIVASLLSAIGVSLLFSVLSVDSFQMAALVGLILGLLIIFPAMLSDSLFCGWGWQLLWIQVGYRALSVFLMSVVVYFL
ncbi:DUF1761 domain-containing protein [Alginatibacterium sediminis]|uniref:DUF1761 domain-containing protein n=1 Tax=Alginatibacterium sediminis TaxID=2164068 RepID=A0A420EDB5_9ALTE|nr:DUF1761 domain-containing protein [Alginatibacterium sediminis]RKF18729.1 DUF1761 domain-containing protein [Alginatibacterium sediminis]